MNPSATEQVRAARDLLLLHREDYAAARREFRWPRPETFNFTTDWFEAVLVAEHPERPALKIIEDDGSENSWTFAELGRRAEQVAGWLRSEGVRPGMRLLLLLGNQVELWECMLAAIKLGAVVIPGSTLLGPDDLRDRIDRGEVGAVIARSELVPKFDDVHGGYLRIAVGAPAQGWVRYSDSEQSLLSAVTDVVTTPDTTLLLYFTSGTTALPKLVEHTHTSYPLGHLSTMYALGLRPGDVHVNVSSPGWAKHAWSCFFAPWLAGATICILNYSRFEPKAMLDVLRDAKVTSFCAPPTVWRMLIQQDLGSWQTSLRSLASAGEPLNPEVIDQVSRAWGITIRDGFGQTETVLVIGNSPGQPIKVGSMGRVMPGFEIDLVDPATGELADEGEICIPLGPERPVGLLVGYLGNATRNEEAFDGGRYHTGDVANRDADGYITYVGRTDDVFKSSDYRISPFELESVLLEHPAVAEAAVVPSPDAVRLAVPKAFVAIVAGSAPDEDLAADILRHCREHVAPYKRVRRIEFVVDLPKTTSGKIRRVELRVAEAGREGERSSSEFREEDFSS